MDLQALSPKPIPASGGSAAIAQPANVSDGEQAAAMDAINPPRAEEADGAAIESGLGPASNYRGFASRNHRRARRRWSAAEHARFVDGLERFGRRSQPASESWSNRGRSALVDVDANERERRI